MQVCRDKASRGGSRTTHLTRPEPVFKKLKPTVFLQLMLHHIKGGEEGGRKRRRRGGRGRGAREGGDRRDDRSKVGERSGGKPKPNQRKIIRPEAIRKMVLGKDN